MDWLRENFPQLHTSAELERAWVWLVADLRGDHNKETRERLKEYGFRFAKGGHVLPSGHTGGWAHHCEKPIAFRHKKKPGNKTTNDRPDPIGQSDDKQDFEEAAKFFGS